MEAYRELIEQSLSRCRRHSGTLFAVVRVDCFRSAAAESLQASVRTHIRREDSLFFEPPSSFVLVLADLKHLSDPLRICQRLWQRFPEELLRFGIAISLSGYESASEMIRASVEGCTKASPAARFQHAEPEMGEQASARLALEKELAGAFRAGQLKTYFQPIVDLAQGSLRGFEALVRWEHPQRGLLLSREFLEVAEGCGLLMEIDRFVLDGSLRQLAAWHRAGHPVRVNVNLNPRHFLEEKGMEDLRPVLEAHRRSIQHLRVDIGETVLFEESGIQALHELKGLQIGFHLDDFEVGPNSFHWLTSFPFDCLKIDRSLIAEMEEEVNAELITAVLRIAKRLKTRTAAEGIITHAQLEELRGLGADEAQGFLFSPTVPAEEAFRLLTQGLRW